MANAMAPYFYGRRPDDLWEPPGKRTGVPPNSLGFSPDLATLNPDGSFPWRASKYIARGIGRAARAPLDYVSSFLPEADLPFPFGDAAMAFTASTAPLPAAPGAPLSAISSQPHVDKNAEARKVFERHLERERSQAYARAVRRLEEILLWPLRDQTGAYHVDRLLSPWIYYKDIALYDVLTGLIPGLAKGASIERIFKYFSDAWENPLTIGLDVLSYASELVTRLLKTRVKVPRELLAVFDIKSPDVYSGSLRPSLTYLQRSPRPIPYSEIRNLASVTYPNLGTPRGMNTVWTFQRIRCVS